MRTDGTLLSAAAATHRRPGQAEIAFVVIEAYQGKASKRCDASTLYDREQRRLKELIAEVLPENRPCAKY